MGNLLSSESEGPREPNKSAEDPRKGAGPEQVIDYSEVREKFRKKKRSQLSIRSEGDASGTLWSKSQKTEAKSNRFVAKEPLFGSQFGNSKSKIYREDQKRREKPRTKRPNKSAPGKKMKARAQKTPKKGNQNSLDEMVKKVSQIEHLLVL